MERRTTSITVKFSKKENCNNLPEQVFLLASRNSKQRGLRFVDTTFLGIWFVCHFVCLFACFSFVITLFTYLNRSDKYTMIMETKLLFQQILLCTMEENREIKVFTVPLTIYLKRESARGSRKSTRNLYGRGFTQEQPDNEKAVSTQCTV